MTTQEIVVQALAVGIPLLGTGSWVGYLLRNHNRRLETLEQDVPTRAPASRVDQLEKAMPKELETRLRRIEDRKLDAKEHTRLCATTMQRIEVLVGSIQQTVQEHSGRLAKGEDLFRELTGLAGELKASLKQANSKHGDHICPFANQKGGT